MGSLRHAKLLRILLVSRGGFSRNPPENTPLTVHETPQVTITFFTDGNVFQNAQRQYKNFMHKILLRPMIVLDSNDDGTEKFPDGSLLPPFQVSPHTQSIPQWVATKGASATTLIMAQVRTPILRRMSNSVLAIVQPAPESITVYWNASLSGSCAEADIDRLVRSCKRSAG